MQREQRKSYWPLGGVAAIIVMVACFIMVKSSASLHPCPKPAAFPPDGSNSCSLIYDKQDRSFRLTISNNTKKEFALRRYWPDYEVRVFDRRGNQISNLQAGLDRFKLKAPSERQWHVMQPGDQISFPVMAFNVDGEWFKTFAPGCNADCVIKGAGYLQRERPGFVVRSKAPALTDLKMGRITL